VVPIVVVVWDMSVLELAPCQCHSLGAIHTGSPARTRCGASLLADEPVARSDLEQLSTFVLAESLDRGTVQLALHLVPVQ
jgi:hypothetical protein